METFQRAYESSLDGSQDITGRVFAFDQRYEADGMQEVINKDTEIEIPKNCMALLSHKKESMLGRTNANLSFEKKQDGLWFKIKQVPTQLFSQARELVKSKVIGGVSPGFSAVPTYEGNCRKFKKIILNEISLVGNPAIDSSFVHAREKESKQTVYPPECYL